MSKSLDGVQCARCGRYPIVAAQRGDGTYVCEDTHRCRGRRVRRLIDNADRDTLETAALRLWVSRPGEFWHVFGEEQA